MEPDMELGTLEALIDAHGLNTILACLHHICLERAQDIRDKQESNGSTNPQIIHVWEYNACLILEALRRTK